MDHKLACHVVQSRGRKATRSPSRPLKDVSESIKNIGHPRVDSHLVPLSHAVGCGACVNLFRHGGILSQVLLSFGVSSWAWTAIRMDHPL